MVDQQTNSTHAVIPMIPNMGLFQLPGMMDYAVELFQDLNENGGGYTSLPQQFQELRRKRFWMEIEGAKPKRPWTVGGMLDTVKVCYHPTDRTRIVYCSASRPTASSTPT